VVAWVVVREPVLVVRELALVEPVLVVEALAEGMAEDLFTTQIKARLTLQAIQAGLMRRREKRPISTGALCSVERRGSFDELVFWARFDLGAIGAFGLSAFRACMKPIRESRVPHLAAA
jgi:hypothetical protein